MNHFFKYFLTYFYKMKTKQIILKNKKPPRFHAEAF